MFNNLTSARSGLLAIGMAAAFIASTADAGALKLKNPETVVDPHKLRHSTIRFN